MRIFRTLLFLTGVGVFAPSPPDELAAGGQPPGQPEISTLALVGTAATAFSDVAGLCSRQPEFCKAAGYVAGRLEVKAKYSAKLIYEWASESSNPAGTDMLKTGSVTQTDTSVQSQGQSTLLIDDLVPAWRGPVLPKKS
ncbi:MAG: DUF5330 domain-containing protein [Rhizobiales bacterium]|nr:DUF5330 domain-containing protein [Hyphomicrobiales bacterium]MBI3673713.1 DUF5330 domain-containing protein [Hyphomicrobiales bacterium]